MKKAVLKSQRPLSRLRLALVVIPLIALGIFFVWRIFAASPTAFEAETGALANGATAVVSSGASGGSAAKFATPTPTPASDGSVFTFAALPDTQRDLWNDADAANRFNGRLNWLAQNKTALNLKYMWQVGDLQDTDNLIFSKDKAVNPRYIASFPIDHYQYEKASSGLTILDRAGIPYALSVGNHDTGAVCGGPACPVVAGQTQKTTVEVRNTTTWNKYYPPSRFPGIVTMEAGKTDNAYRLVTAGGVKWMILSYELWPRTEVVNWMKTVVAANPSYNVILVSHSYLNGGGGIEGSNGGYGANSPQYVYDQVISKYANIRMTFSGHVGNSDYRVDTGVNGNKIYSFLDCYHDTTNNWIRLLTVDTANNTIKTRVYSPYTNQTRTEASANVSISGINWVR